ncbi:hypothetical protein SVAN01_05537 [Stagonosporopsis vannaccii]|nr:hypothetical protein SVAN01_05537 [Stagonosporopsis vannaccii]
MVSQPHSDLEVVAPSANDTHKYPYYAPDSDPKYPTPNPGSDTNKIAYESAVHEHKPPQTICGLRKRTFWILVGVAIVVVAAAVGGGVGGALASRSSSNATTSSSSSDDSSNNAAQTTQSSAQPSAQSPSTSATPTSSTPAPALTTTTIVGPANSPQPTLLRDCPSSNNTLYTVTYGSKSYQFRKLCNDAYLNINGVTAPVQGVFSTLDECIDKCASYNRNNATAIAAGRDPICNSVCWRNTFDGRNDWEGGHCFGFTTGNTTVGGETQFRVTGTGDICDSAALINQEI